ncbi:MULTISPECIES: LysR family transcriptional regulator [Pseudomonas]|uniref:LysR family transcriptional regulator n=3 Tax=Pseudomonas TaxID=286 RepID=A0ABX6HBM8_9PSED|nr:MULTISPECIES: LysR family transcriptional regulator [Pseudomonas]MBC3955971.1 LysR family transcriptional regulator [Pseudomonas triticifolii]QHF02803.1 LysR family transcriptional regulator [Pseudomonas asturiensis]
MLNSNALRKLDMQDLMVFVSVFEQRNLTLVSEALHVSQSTVSYCLKKLRANFEDDLFISTRNGMRPTRKAIAMHSHVQQILHKVNLCHNGLNLFDPSNGQTTFSVCAPEYFELLVLPHLLRGFIASGFSVAVNVQKLDKHLPVEPLNDSRIDLALCFGPGFHGVPDSLISHVLLEDDLVCVMDSQRAPLTALIDLETFTTRPHVYPTPWTSDTNMVDGWLQRQGLERQIVARANSYRAALQLLEGTDFILVLPRRIQTLLGSEPWVAVFELPPDLPGFTLDMVWSAQVDQDEANGWFREQVVKVCAEQGLL